MRKVWAVSEGSYSDYKVNALFETEELAEAAKDAAGGFVEEFVLYDKIPAKVPHHHVFVVQGELGMFTWNMANNPRTVHLQNGWHILEEHREDWPWDYSPPSKRPAFRGTRISERDRGKWAFFYEGRDAEACRKAAYDKIIELETLAKVLDMQKVQQATKQRLTGGSTEGVS